MQKRIRDACGPRVRVVLLSSILTQHHPRGTSGISGGAPRIPVVSNSLYRPGGHGGHPRHHVLKCKRGVDERRSSFNRSWSMSSTQQSFLGIGFAFFLALSEPERLSSRLCLAFDRDDCRGPPPSALRTSGSTRSTPARSSNAPRAWASRCLLASPSPEKSQKN